MTTGFMLLQFLVLQFADEKCYIKHLPEFESIIFRSSAVSVVTKCTDQRDNSFVLQLLTSVITF
jgi:hypothetical protein